MSTDDVVSEVREALNGRPGQPIVLGVCGALATRYGHEPWAYRLAAIFLTLFWTIPALAAYIALGFLLSETETRSRGFFNGLAVIIRETAEKVLDGIRDLFDGNGNQQYRRPQ